MVVAAGQARALRPGEVAVVRGPAEFVVGDQATTEPRFVVTTTEYCERVDGSSAKISLDPRTCGYENGRDLLLSGAFNGTVGISDRLLDALPDVLVVPAERGHQAILDLIAVEISLEQAGQQVVLDRLLDLMLVATLRVWFDEYAEKVPAWYGAIEHPVVGPALRLLHDRPADRWTVASLAGSVGVSRAALARQFTRLVGMPPMAYLACWRVTLAADLLRETDATVSSIARKVGYANTFALSVAFKRLRGVTPSQHRQEVRSG